MFVFRRLSSFINLLREMCSLSRFGYFIIVLIQELFLITGVRSVHIFHLNFSVSVLISELISFSSRTSSFLTFSVRGICNALLQHPTPKSLYFLFSRPLVYSPNDCFINEQLYKSAPSVSYRCVRSKNIPLIL